MKSMARHKRLWIILSAGLALTLCCLSGATWWLANRPSEPPSKEIMTASLNKAKQWLRVNESRVLADGNSALWWMIQDAGRRSGDVYLQSLPSKAIARHFSGADAMEPWRRMLEPSVEVKAYSRGINHLEEYQRFFHHSLTCLPLEIEGGDTSQYLLRDMCSPMLTKVFLTDRVCTTHQLFGLMFIRQTGCPGVPPLAALEHQLLDNVEIQLKWDPIVRDAYIQRLLMLALNDRPHAIKPIWLKRLLSAQEADGGWLGYSRIPEVPTWMQPRHWQRLAIGSEVAKSGAKPDEIDFHATAQAILLLTILTQAD